MSELLNDTVLRALLRQPTEYTPVWLMRQAGRYLPEYREVRQKAGSFMSLCADTVFATEVSLQPVERFKLDAAIIFSDILTIPDAMGLGLSFVEGQGPKFERSMQHERDISALQPPPMDKLRYVFDVVRSVRRALNRQVPLIGFAGSPFTLACYMVEGGASSDFKHVRRMLYERPDLLHNILSVNAMTIKEYLNAQIDAGAQIIQIFDTWGGILTQEAYIEFSLAYIQQIISGLVRKHENRPVPVIVFSKGGGMWLDAMVTCGADALGLDWTTDMAMARKRVGSLVALQGNCDPYLLMGEADVIERGVENVLNKYGKGGGHVFNLGHGLSPHTDPDKVGLLVEAVHRLSGKYH